MPEWIADKSTFDIACPLLGIGGFTVGIIGLAFGYKQYRDQKKTERSLEEAQQKLADVTLDAKKWRLIAESRALAAQAERMMTRDRPRALNLAMQAWHTAETEEGNLAVARALPQHLFNLEGHTGNVREVAVSPDGQRIITASADHTARVWNACTGQLLFKLEGHTSDVHQAAFSRDGQRIVTSSADQTARLWDAVTGKPVATLKGHVDDVQIAKFSPDSQRIITIGDVTARIWSAANGQFSAELDNPPYGFSDADFSPDSQHIVMSGLGKGPNDEDVDNTAVWNASTGKLLFKLADHTGDVQQATYSPDGQRIVSACDDNTARVWDASTGQLLLNLEGHTAT